MSETTTVLHLGTNIFLLPVRPGGSFWADKNSYFFVISIPVAKVQLIAAGYGGGYYDLTPREFGGHKYATTDDPNTGDPVVAVLHVEPVKTPNGNAIHVRGRQTLYRIGVLDDAGGYLYAFDYYADDRAGAVFEFLEDQAGLLTLPGAV